MHNFVVIITLIVIAGFILLPMLNEMSNDKASDYWGIITIGVIIFDIGYIIVGALIKLFG